MISREEINGEISAASGVGVVGGVKPTERVDQFDRQLIECLQDEAVSQDYLYNPKVNRFTLMFTKPTLEAAYRRHYADTSVPRSGNAALTLAVPSFSSLFDTVVSLVFFVLVGISCFAGFTISTSWVAVVIVGLAVEFSFVLPLLLNVICVDRAASVAAPLGGEELSPGGGDGSCRIFRRLLRFMSSWYPRHVFGIVVASLPTIAAFSAFSCQMFSSTADHTDRFFCLLVLTTLLHFCNFTMLSSWLKSVLATCAGVVLLILLAVGACRDEATTKSTFHMNGTGFNAATATAFAYYNTTVPGGVIDQDEIFNGEHPVRFEIIIDVVMLLLLVWFLNREIEISYRLCFHGYAESVLDRNKIMAEKEQADWLLHNIVPEHVANQLKTHEFYSHTINKVGIIFAKISNFDDFYDEAYQGGKEFLRVLNELMGDFEDLFDLPKFKDVEKIKTIGSCLMAASGLNSNTRQQNRNPMAHLYSLMDFALALLAKLDQFNREMLCFKFEMEIGYNFGEVTAGVVGTTKLLYDIWGDAVNVASRMYSTGVHGRIQVTEDVAKSLEEMFEFEYRGRIPVKGKGDLNTYLLVGKRQGASWH